MHEYADRLPTPAGTGFNIGLMREDIRLALAMASELGVRLPSTDSAKDVLGEAIELGYERKDIAALFEVLEHGRQPRGNDLKADCHSSAQATLLDALGRTPTA